MATQKHKDYSITVNLLIFVTLISIVGVSRLIIIGLTHKNTFEDISVIETLDYNTNVNMTETLNKAKNTMEDYYNFDIYYGDVLSEILPAVDANVITNEKAILNMLQNINTEFEKYPKEIIEEIQSKGYKISVYLVDSFNNGNVALANRTANGYFNIFLSNDKEFDKAMHHEFYHILEYYIKLEYDLGLLYINWDEYNPKLFKYEEDLQKLDAKYVYGLDDINDIHFVTMYAKYSAAEDRAEVFSEMMVSREPYNKRLDNRNIISKMGCITDVLDAVFYSVDENEYWQRYNEWEI